jgi:O-antigen/teichoic acid export membrane protein
MNPPGGKSPGLDLGPGKLRSDKKSLSFRVVRGVVFSLVRKLVIGPLFLLLVPFILHRVGNVGYGTWSILGTIIGLGWFLDLGVSASVTRHIAESRGRGDVPELRRLVDASCAMYLVIATVFYCVLYFFSSAVIRELFRGPEVPKLAEILSLWSLLLPTIAVDLLTKPFIAVITGFQRIDLTNVLLFCGNACNAILTVIFLLSGAKLQGLLLAAFLSALLVFIASIIMAVRLLPSFVPNPFGCDFHTVKRICSFSLGLYAGSIMTTIQGQVEKLYLARFVGVVPVGWYDMANQAASKVRRMPDLLLGPVMAAASELDAAGERDKMAQLYFRAHKYLAVTIIPLVVYALFAAKPLVTVWLGAKYSFIALPFALLVVGNLFPQMGAPIYFVLVGRGILRPSIYAALIASVLNVVLSFIFILRWGFVGAVWGTVIPMFVSSVYFFIACERYSDIPFIDIMRRAYLKPLLCSLVAGGSMFATNALGMHLWLRLLVGTAVYAVVYLFGLGLARFFDEFDFIKAEGHLPFVRLARRVIPVSYSTQNY